MKSLRLSVFNDCKQGYGKWMITLLAFLFFSSLYAQQPDTLRGPDVHINVHTDRDNQGNIIKYDSSYSYSWSSPGDSIIFADSLFSGHAFLHGWPYRPGMLMPDSLPGFIISPFDFEGNPFFYGFTDSTFFRSVEKLFREFRNGFSQKYTFPIDSLLAPYFKHRPGSSPFPEMPPVPNVPDVHKKQIKKKTPKKIDI